MLPSLLPKLSHVNEIACAYAQGICSYQSDRYPYMPCQGDATVAAPSAGAVSGRRSLKYESGAAFDLVCHALEVSTDLSYNSMVMRRRTRALIVAFEHLQRPHTIIGVDD